MHAQDHSFILYCKLFAMVIKCRYLKEGASGEKNPEMRAQNTVAIEGAGVTQNILDAQDQSDVVLLLPPISRLFGGMQSTTHTLTHPSLPYHLHSGRGTSPAIIATVRAVSCLHRLPLLLPRQGASSVVCPFPTNKGLHSTTNWEAEHKSLNSKRTFTKRSPRRTFASQFSFSKISCTGIVLQCCSVVNVLRFCSLIEVEGRCFGLCFKDKETQKKNRIQDGYKILRARCCLK